MQLNKVNNRHIADYIAHFLLQQYSWKSSARFREFDS